MLPHFLNRSGGPQWLIAGLGNPGIKYEQTRHNAGFLLLDLLAGQQHIRVDRMKNRALIGDGEIGGVRCLLVKPQTFMNDSGMAVGPLAAFYKIPPERVLILSDDISLTPGRLRIRRSGSDGGHNGLKSVILYLNSEDFPRLKLGIGAKPHPEMELADWVLSKFSDAERKTLQEALEKAAQAVPLIVAGKIDEAMNLYNS